MSSCQLMFPGFRSFLEFSSFGFKPPASGFHPPREPTPPRSARVSPAPAALPAHSQPQWRPREASRSHPAAQNGRDRGFIFGRGLTLLSQLCRDPAVGVRNGEEA